MTTPRLTEQELADLRALCEKALAPMGPTQPGADIPDGYWEAQAGRRDLGRRAAYVFRLLAELATSKERCFVVEKINAHLVDDLKASEAWRGRLDAQVAQIQSDLALRDTQLANAATAHVRMQRELEEARALLKCAEGGLSSATETDEGWLSAAIPLIDSIRAYLARQAQKEQA